MRTRTVSDTENFLLPWARRMAGQGPVCGELLTYAKQTLEQAYQGCLEPGHALYFLAYLKHPQAYPLALWCVERTRLELLALLRLRQSEPSLGDLEREEVRLCLTTLEATQPADTEEGHATLLSLYKRENTKAKPQDTSVLLSSSDMGALWSAVRDMAWWKVSLASMPAPGIMHTPDRWAYLAGRRARLAELRQPAAHRFNARGQKVETGSANSAKAKAEAEVRTMVLAEARRRAPLAEVQQLVEGACPA